jgi:phosphate transport system substrate-binding protein
MMMLAACGDNQPLNLQVNPELGSVIGTSQINLAGQFAGSGSSAQKAAIDAWIAGYNVYQPNADIAYDPSGSGAGVNSFLQGAVVWAGSDKPLTADERKQSESVCNGQQAVDIPVYISPLAVVYNLPELGSEHVVMSADVIAGIFAGKIAKWNAKEIKDLNPKLANKLPDLPITPVWRSDKSGTTNSFTSYLSQAAPNVWETEPAETWPNTIGQGAKGTAGVVSAVSQAPGTVGYADAAQAVGLGTVAVEMKDAKGNSVGVAPSADKAAVLVGQAIDAAQSENKSAESKNDMVVNPDYASTSADVYPIAQVSYSVVCPTYSSQRDSNFVGSWLIFEASDDGQRLAAMNAGSAPIPQALATQITDFAKTLISTKKVTSR